MWCSPRAGIATISRSELAKLRAALDVVPSDVYIDADANQGWRSAQWTVSVLKRFAGHDNLSIEQPLPHADLAGAAFVRAHAGIAGHSRRIGLVARGADADRADGRLRPHGAEAQPHRRLLSRRAGASPSARPPASASASTPIPTPSSATRRSATSPAMARTPYPVDCEGHVSFLDIGRRIRSGAASPLAARTPNCPTRRASASTSIGSCWKGIGKTVRREPSGLAPRFGTVRRSGPVHADVSGNNQGAEIAQGQ